MAKCCVRGTGIVLGLCVAWNAAALQAADRDANPASREADALWRHLDADSDGKVGLGDARGNNRGMIAKILEMAGKPDSGSVTRAEFQKVFDTVQAARKNRGAPEPGPRPAPDARPAPEARPVPGTRPNPGPQRPAESAPSRDPNPRPQPESRPAAPAETTPATANPAEGGAARGAGLDGTWRGWVVDQGGRNHMELELTIRGSRIDGREIGTKQAPDGLGGGTYLLAGDGRRGNLDADGTSGSVDGRHFMGIYERDGDTLRWCVSNRGRQRPQQMATDRGNYLLVLRRQ